MLSERWFETITSVEKMYRICACAFSCAGVCVYRFIIINILSDSRVSPKYEKKNFLALFFLLPPSTTRHSCYVALVAS